MLIDEITCIGCGICVKAAPEAIKIVNLPEILDKDPIHRFGENEFALFNLPIPTLNHVIGILGVNGIGKSTAISILGGILKPNFGNLGEEADYKKIIDFFKGTELQLFFEKVKDKKIKISYKPQQVELIPKAKKGKVKALLKKVDEKNKLNEIAKELEIEDILDNNIGKISGGELQRVAIAAAFLKKADLYIFDEPTSYLDIKQRINVSKFIRNLADELGISTNECIAIGDSRADIEMFKVVGYQNSFAYNANEEVRKFAKHHIKDFKEIMQIIK